MIASYTFAAIDFESAGAAHGKTDVPVQIGMATWSVAKGYADSYVSYIGTDQAVTWSAQKIHGIRHEDLADSPPLLSLWPQIKSTLSGRPLVAHGHGTEKRYLSTFPGHGLGPWIDTLQLYRAAWPELSSHALGDLCEHFKLTQAVSSLVPDRTWHDALYDATASLTLLEHLVQSYQLGSSDLEILLKPDTRQWRSLRN